MKPKMKAYLAGYEGDEWVTYVHGETRGKAKTMFMNIDPSGDQDWNSARLKRVPAWDDKPFVKGDEYNNLFTPDSYDEHGDPIYNFNIFPDCGCVLCRGAK